MIKKPKGTYDLYGEDAIIYEFLLDIFKGMCENGNYKLINTPTFEASELFHRGVGDDTDIVTKETYNFKDRADRNLTLRPEGTAGIVRSIIENKLYANTTDYLKYYYYGSMFRYERPQAGRFREFNQFGVEIFGPMDYYTDAEIINLGVNYFRSLGLKDIVVKINSIGSKEERDKYKDSLIKYLEKYESELCSDCKRRLKTNPLRALDCKVCQDKEFFKNNPKISDYLNKDSKNYFDSLLELLTDLEIEYEVDENLVRGLDYYDFTVFEFMTNDERLGSAKTICGGGRYNNLVSTLDGPDLNGVGFAIGVERLMELCKSIETEKLIRKEPLIYVASVAKEQKSDAFIIGLDLRDMLFKVHIDYRDIALKKKITNADKIGANYMIIIGEDEIKNFSVILKDMLTKEETTVKINNLAEELELTIK